MAPALLTTFNLPSLPHRIVWFSSNKWHHLCSTSDCHPRPLVPNTTVIQLVRNNCFSWEPPAFPDYPVAGSISTSSPPTHLHTNLTFLLYCYFYAQSSNSYVIILTPKLMLWGGGGGGALEVMRALVSEIGISSLIKWALQRDSLLLLLHMDFVKRKPLHRICWNLTWPWNSRLQNS